MKAYLFSVSAAALLSTAVAALVPEGAGRRCAQLGCGLLMLLTLLSPAVKLDYDALARQLASVRMEAETLRTGVEVRNRELQARIISEQAAAYILDKAGQLGLSLTAEVEMRDTGAGAYPYRVLLTGICTAESRAALRRFIEENLAIPAERQVWQCG